MQPYFDAPMLEVAQSEISVNIQDTPYFYNDQGVPTYLKTLPEGVEVLELIPNTNAIGNEYDVPGIINQKDDGTSGIETQLGFAANQVEYEALWATREIAAAFGILLVEQGQAVKISSPVETLSQIEYEYGVFAGHWSPYQGTGNQLLSVVCTDLEHHNFPHVFASTDPDLPLVISVGRYWPKLGKIRLADLWVPQGSALYIPPKLEIADQDYMDLHNNRNSAHACWGNIHKNSLQTHTLLQADNGYFYWYWNPTPTVHPTLTLP
ncbi:hypothetical protein [Acinetobacter sp. MB5]|uniref:hypothetical protein n=1 Tax=Acinetobacter sp. MB5 TaxID=2069438 RepID=UPI000DD0E8C3|nr:hypothetical protein [Acinetobacter sp. MB5]